MRRFFHGLTRWFPVGAVLTMIAVTVPVLCVSAEDRGYSDVNLEWLEKKQRAQNWGRDPFVLPESSTVQGKDVNDSGLHLSAIIYRQGRGVAIINDQILRKGDTIGERKVEEIHQDRVVLQDPSGRHELRVNRFVMDQ
jgi:hypothetical protein